MPRRSKVWSVTTEQLQVILDNSASYNQVLKQVGYDIPSGASLDVLKKRISNENIATEKFVANKEKVFGKRPQIRSLEDVLTEKSDYNRGSLKKRLIKCGLLEYKCQGCDNLGEWLGKQLVLQLDHINGIRDDNRLENLRFLCPNCHSLTDTFCGKNKLSNPIEPFIKLPRKEAPKCQDCGKLVSKTSKRCPECQAKSIRIFDPPKEELEDFVLKQRLSFTVIGKKYGVTEQAVRKRCKIFGIVRRGYCSGTLFSEEQQVEIRALRAMGISYENIAKSLGVTPGVVSYFCRKNEIKKG